MQETKEIVVENQENAEISRCKKKSKISYFHY